MNTTYRSKKQVTRLMAGFSHTLSLLMSMLRVSLEAAWSMARVWLDYAYSEITARLQRDYGSSVTSLRLVVSLLLLVVASVADLRAATINFDLPNGYYYLGNEAGNNNIPKYDSSNFAANFYLCPAYSTTVNEQNYLGSDSEKPLITTFKSFSDANKNQGKTYSWAVWYIEAAIGDNAGYFYIKHRDSGQYLIANDNTLPKANRRRINLGPTSDPGNDCLFRIQSDDSGTTYYISSKTKADNKNKYLNPSAGNIDNLAATDANDNTGGIFGFYETKTTNSAWHFVQVPCETPVIDYNNTTSKVSITSTTPECTIYYTTDGDTPPSSSTLYSDPFSIDSQTTVIKAIATKEGYSNSEIASIKVLLNPIITLATNEYTYDGSAKEPEVTSVMDGTTPIDVNEYTVSYTDNIDAGTATVKIKDNPGGEYIISGSTTFTINPAGVTLTANSGTEPYDGTEKTVTGFTCSVDNLTFEGVSASGSGTDMGEYPVTFTGVIIGTTKDTSGNYVVTSIINGTLTISRKQLTITAGSETKVYDGTPLTKDSYSHTNLFAGEHIESVTITGSQTDAGTSDNVPSAAVIKNSNDDDVTASYDIIYVNGTLTVSPKEVGITWGETTTFVYDANSHAPSATATGLLNGDEVGVSVTGQQTNVGDDYTATVSGLTGDKAGNYTIDATYTKNFSITRAALTITAKDRTISYGDEPSNWGVDYKGFKGEDNEKVLGGTLSYAYNYEQYDELGNYTITPSGLTSPNYDITYQTGTLTVKKRTIVLKWTNTSFTYDGEAHLPTATATGMVNGEEIGVTVSGTQTNAGKHSATASGLTGEKVVHYELPTNNTHIFTIAPKRLGDGDLPAEGITISLNPEGELEYVKDGDVTLTTDEDYTCDIQHEGSDQIVAVTGTGNYTGSLRGIYAKPQFFDVDGEGAGKATAVYMSSRDVNNFVGVNAYTVKSVNTFLGLITVNKLKYIPKGVPVLLLSDSEASGFVVTEKDEDIADVSNDTINSNLLKMAPAEGVVVENAQVYMFYKGEFVLTKAGTITEGKFYLNNPSYTDNPADPAPVPARGTLMIVEEETTGLVTLPDTANKPADDVWYTLDGRRLNGKPANKGLYINNGRKTVIK